MQSETYSKSNVKKSAKIFLFGRILSAVSGFAVIILFASGMKTDEYAAFISLSSVAVLATTLVSLGLDRALNRFIPPIYQSGFFQTASHLIWTLFFVRVIASIILGIILYYLFPFFSATIDFVNFEKLPFVVLAFFFFQGLFNFFVAVFQSLMMQLQLTYILIIQWFGRLLLLILVVSFEYELILIVAFQIMLFPELFGVLVFGVTLFKKFLKNRINPDNRGTTLVEWKELRKLSTNNYFYTLLVFPPQGYFMRILISTFYSAEITAAYGFFSLLFERLARFIPIRFFSSIIEPYVNANYSKTKDWRKNFRILNIFYKLGLLVLAISGILIVFFAENLIRNYVNSEYVDYLWITWLLLLQVSIGTNMPVLQIFCNMVDRSKYLLLSSLKSTLVFVPLISLALFLSVDAFWIIILPVVYSFINNFFVYIWLLKNSYFIGGYYREVLIMLLFSFVALFAVQQLDINSLSWTVQATTFILLLTIYSLFITFISFSKSEFISLKNTIKRR